MRDSAVHANSSPVQPSRLALAHYARRKDLKMQLAFGPIADSAGLHFFALS
jgi:hypothetical protein